MRSGLVRGFQRGVTLIELVVALVVLGILLSVALPSFQSFIAGNQLRSTSANFVLAVNTARGQAMNYRVPVQIRSINSDWSNGWMIEYPAGINETNQSFSVFGDTTVKLVNGSEPLTFRFDGTSQEKFEFHICPGGRAKTGRKMTVSPLGRISNENKEDCKK